MKIADETKRLMTYFHESYGIGMGWVFAIRSEDQNRKKENEF